MSEETYQPPKKTLKLEFIVGLFFLIGLLCFAYLSVNLAKMSLTDAGFYKLSAEFENISGLNEGAAVEIAGVKIGEVSEIKLNDTYAEIILKIENEVQLRDDDIASVRTKGIIGDKYVKIVPGGSDEILNDGDALIETESTLDIEDLIGKFVHSMDG